MLAEDSKVGEKVVVRERDAGEEQTPRTSFPERQPASLYQPGLRLNLKSLASTQYQAERQLRPILNETENAWMFKFATDGQPCSGSTDSRPLVVWRTEANCCIRSHFSFEFSGFAAACTCIRDSTCSIRETRDAILSKRFPKFGTEKARDRGSLFAAQH